MKRITLPDGREGFEEIINGSRWQWIPDSPYDTEGKWVRIGSAETHSSLHLVGNLFLLVVSVAATGYFLLKLTDNAPPNPKGFENPFFWWAALILGLVLTVAILLREHRNLGCLVVWGIIAVLLVPYINEVYTRPDLVAKRQVEAPIDMSDSFDATVLCGISRLRHSLSDYPIRAIEEPCYER